MRRLSCSCKAFAYTRTRSLPTLLLTSNLNVSNVERLLTYFLTSRQCTTNHLEPKQSSVRQHDVRVCLAPHRALFCLARDAAQERSPKGNSMLVKTFFRGLARHEISLPSADGVNKGTVRPGEELCEVWWPQPPCWVSWRVLSRMSKAVGKKQEKPS